MKHGDEVEKTGQGLPACKEVRRKSALYPFNSATITLTICPCAAFVTVTPLSAVWA